MTRLYQTNALLPLRWISQLLPLFGREPCTLAVLSARVGSIGDNRAGGWYGYRASKAALNMLLKCAAIELARRAPASNCWPSIPAQWIPNSPARFTPMYRREMCRVPSW